MKEKDIMLKIDSLITRDPEIKSRNKFCKRTNRSPQSFNQTMNSVIYEDKSIVFENLESIANDLGYELILTKKQEKQ